MLNSRIRLLKIDIPPRKTQFCLLRVSVYTPNIIFGGRVC